jgi:hypothetical protein
LLDVVNLTCLILLIFLSVLLNAEPKLYVALRPRWANPMLGVPRLVWAVLIAARFLLLVSFLAKLVHLFSARVMLLLRNRSSLSCSCRSICLMCCRRDFFCCLRCSRGSGGMMVCRRPFAVLGRSCCRWWGCWVGRVWQMHYAVWV